MTPKLTETEAAKRASGSYLQNNEMPIFARGTVAF
jgi:hypothetical protein